MAENNYTPKYKVNDIVLSLRNKDYGRIKQIDNKCSKIYDKAYENPHHLEYYVFWNKGAWTRHYCFELDAGQKDLIVVTPAVRVLYGNRKLPK